MRSDPRTSETAGEARELAAALSRELLAGESLEGLAINGLFRTAHSLKGLAGILGAADAARLAHAVEDVFDELRHGRARMAAPLRAALLEAIDRTALLLDAPDPEAAAQLCGRLREALAAAAVEEEEGGLDSLDLPAVVRDALTDYEKARLAENLRQQRLVHRVTAAFRLDDFDTGLEEIQRRVADGGELLATLPASSDAEITFELLVASRHDALALGAALASLPVRIEPVGRAAPPPAEEEAAEEPGPEQRVRVSLAALRALEESVRGLARGGSEAVAAVQRAAHRLAHVPAADLAAGVERQIASVAAAWGRQVGFRAEGTDLALDVATAEALAAPLLHLVRNAIDHGIEAPAERLRRGKPIAGTVVLAFATAAGWIEVRLADDGAGIDADRVAAAARVPPPRDRDEALQLVFLPGVSTAGQGGHSGRGVGLDVVRTAVRRLGGDVRVESAPGAGTTFTLRLPARS